MCLKISIKLNLYRGKCERINFVLKSNSLSNKRVYNAISGSEYVVCVCLFSVLVHHTHSMCMRVGVRLVWMPIAYIYIYIYASFSVTQMRCIQMQWFEFIALANRINTYLLIEIYRNCIYLLNNRGSEPQQMCLFHLGWTPDVLCTDRIALIASNVEIIVYCL